MRWIWVMYHGAVLRATFSHQSCRDCLGVLLSTGALRDHLPQSKQGRTLHRSCRPYSTDEVSTSRACRQERPCERAGPRMGMAAQGTRTCVLLPPCELPGGSMGDKGAATWGHMKVSCAGVPVPSIQGVHSQLSQDWGGHMWDKVFWTPHCAVLRPHTLIALLASQKACRASPPPPKHPLPLHPSPPCPSHAHGPCQPQPHSRCGC